MSQNSSIGTIGSMFSPKSSKNSGLRYSDERSDDETFPFFDKKNTTYESPSYTDTSEPGDNLHMQSPTCLGTDFRTPFDYGEDTQSSGRRSYSSRSTSERKQKPSPEASIEGVVLYDDSPEGNEDRWGSFDVDEEDDFTPTPNKSWVPEMQVDENTPPQLLRGVGLRDMTNSQCLPSPTSCSKAHAAGGGGGRGNRRATVSCSTPDFRASGFPAPLPSTTRTPARLQPAAFCSRGTLDVKDRRSSLEDPACIRESGESTALRDPRRTFSPAMGERKLGASTRLVNVNVLDFDQGVQVDDQRRKRMEAFGINTPLPALQKLILWGGIFSDIYAKVSLVRELSRMGGEKNWVWFSMVFVLFIGSGLLTCIYWLEHYPRPKPPDPKEPLREVFGYRKYDVKVLLRRIGLICAFFQLGTAFAALRTLRSDRPDRQRKAYMEMRGMRLVDTVFLTLSVATVQAYIGIVCMSSQVHCAGREEFDIFMWASVVVGVVAAATCFISFDLKEGLHPVKDIEHLLEMSVVVAYHAMELGARVVTVALFATAMGAWVFVFFLAHAFLVTLLLRYPVFKELRHVWDKLNRTVEITVWGRKMTVPAVDDMKLLWACLIWPTACYVSDSTTAGGKFWWRVPLKESGQLSFSSLHLEEGIIAFPFFNFIQTIEAVVMLSIITFTLDFQDDFLLACMGIAIILTVLWLLMAVVWVSAEFILRPAFFHPLISSSAEHLTGPKGSTAGSMGSNSVLRTLRDDHASKEDTSGRSPGSGGHVVLISSTDHGVEHNSLPVGFSLCKEDYPPHLRENLAQDGLESM